MLMKINKLLRFLFVFSILLLGIATYGTAHDTSCTNTNTSTTHAAYVGLLVGFVGLLAYFRHKKQSWPKTITFSILASLGVTAVFILINIAVQPDGLFHCYVF